ncbi:POT family MFS transporter [Oleiharenicola sp. Vm1]|uniref:POT family MFS transporter n=1 Tax=Oleiharenicola sp. Vm1 TaxID=3398393 RepID=UPI0039F517CE
MAESFRTTPIKTDKMPPGIPFIVANEAAERFCFYGLRAVLVIYMTQYLRNRAGEVAPMNENEANGWYHLFLASNYFFPMMGAFLADVWWGKYRTVFWISLVYCLGCVFLAADDTRLGLFMGLGLIALGAGGIKPCVASNVGDQFGKDNQHLVSRAFGWFYFAVNFGSFFSISLTPILLKNWGPKAAFGLPAVLMFLATFIFWSGRYKFVHLPPKGKKFVEETFNRESLTALGRLAILFVFVAVFWSLWDQSGGEWVLQAEKMQRHVNLFGWEFELLSSQMQAVNAIMILALIPAFQYAFYPAINTVWKLTPLRKIGLGIFTIGVSFLISAWIESQLTAGAKISVMWQLPAYLLLSAGEVMTSITCLEFAYTQSPRHLKAVVNALYLLSISAGNLFTALVQFFIANPDGTSKLHGAAYYHFFAGFAVLASLIFAAIALRYKEVNYLQDEAPANS